MQQRVSIHILPTSNCFEKKRDLKINHGGTEDTEEHRVSVVLCVLRVSVVVLSTEIRTLLARTGSAERSSKRCIVFPFIVYQ